MAVEGGDLLSSPSIWLRLALAACVVVAALPVLPLAPVAGWTAAWALVSGLEQLVARRHGYVATTRRLVLTTLLNQPGLSLTLVENGAQAVEAWRAGPWDLLLIDIQMPVKDGVAATREIRAEEAAGGRARTPIVAVTANALPEQAAEYRRAGMDLVVAKPVEVGKLFKAIATALEAEPAGAEQAA